MDYFTLNLKLELNKFIFIRDPGDQPIFYYYYIIINYYKIINSNSINNYNNNIIITWNKILILN